MSLRASPWTPDSVWKFEPAGCHPRGRARSPSDLGAEGLTTAAEPACALQSNYAENTCGEGVRDCGRTHCHWVGSASGWCHAGCTRPARFPPAARGARRLPRSPVFVLAGTVQRFLRHAPVILPAARPSSLRFPSSWDLAAPVSSCSAWTGGLPAPHSAPRFRALTPGVWGCPSSLPALSFTASSHLRRACPWPPPATCEVRSRRGSRAGRPVASECAPAGHSRVSGPRRNFTAPTDFSRSYFFSRL